MEIFTKKDYKQLNDFIKRYDKLHAAIQDLEESLQTLLSEQKKCVEELEVTRKEEAEFFKALSEKTGKSVQYLKALATDWAMEK